MSRLARIAAGALGILACTGDVPAVPPQGAAPSALCQEAARSCRPDAGARDLDDGVCFSLSLARLMDYTMCWPGTPSAAGAPDGTRMLAALRGGSGPGPRYDCGVRHRCLCVSIHGAPPTLAVTTSLPEPAGSHATGCLIFGAASLPLPEPRTFSLGV